MIRNRRITLSVLTLTTLALMLPAQSAFAGPVVVGANVDVGNGNTFTPDLVNINQGEKVVWTWSSGVHTVTSGDGCPGNVCTPDGVFDSGIATLLDSLGDTFEFTFNNAGTFDYFCLIHGFTMQGSVVVAAVVPLTCGDGIITPPETCEPPNTATCDALCMTITPLTCGDGIITPPETCEPPNTATCDSQCMTITPSQCGDGIIQPPETCEPPNTASCDSQCRLIFVGGEFIGVDSTALLLAGFQLNALWLLPAIAAIGIAAVVIRRIH